MLSVVSDVLKSIAEVDCLQRKGSGKLHESGITLNTISRHVGL